MKNRLLTLSIAAGVALPAVAQASPIYSTNFEVANTDHAAAWSSTLRRNLGGAYSTFLGRFGSTSISFTLNATQENTAGLGSKSGGGNENSPFNITSKEVQHDRVRIPELDGGGGGGFGGSTSSLTMPGFTFDLGSAFNGGSANDEPSTGEPLFTAGQYMLTFDLMLFDSWDGAYEPLGPDSFNVNINGQTMFSELLEVHILSENFRMPDELPEQNAYNPTWQDQIYRDISIVFDVSEATDHLDFEFFAVLDQTLQDESWGLDNVRVDAVGQLRAASIAVPAPGALTLMGAGIGLLSRRKR